MAAIRSQRGDACMNQLLASIERHISHSVQRDLKQQEFLQSSSPSHLLPSFIGDFSRMETGKALALHLIQHMKGQEAEVPLVPPQYKYVHSKNAVFAFFSLSLDLLTWSDPVLPCLLLLAHSFTTHNIVIKSFF